ncbi:peptidase 1 [Auriculariales sp. MPI-PUGE-AT-0066]|nr:peptidase 1 [Auriculariales sp. MPI-PUGE-AT-0066]
MQLSFKLFALCSLALTAVAAPNRLLTVEKFDGLVNAHSYIVTLKPGVCKDSFINADPALRESVTHADWTIIHAFAGIFSPNILNKLRASDAVEGIFEDGFVELHSEQTDAPWGLARTSATGLLPVHNSPAALNYTYAYPDEAQGQGVDIYVLDTGVNFNHHDFGGRATHGWAQSGWNATDTDGHGTHVAGIAAGARFGIAKEANIISVKVLQKYNGPVTPLIAGINWVASTAPTTGRPSVASMSVGSPGYRPLDEAAANLVSVGVPLVVAEGNYNKPAARYSPARVESVITVGAVDMHDSKAWFSNYGPEDITSASFETDSGTARKSGTSQAAPHVSGAVALWLSQNPDATPEELKRSLWSTTGVVKKLCRSRLNRMS